EFHDALFSWQAAYANTAFSQNRLSTGIVNLGIDKSKWDACMSSGLPEQVVNAAMNAFQVQNVPGTPTIFVNGTQMSTPDLSVIDTAIDQEIVKAGLKPGTAPAGSTQPTSEARAEATSQPTAQESTPEATTSP